MFVAYITLPPLDGLDHAVPLHVSNACNVEFHPVTPVEGDVGRPLVAHTGRPNDTVAPTVVPKIELGAVFPIGGGELRNVANAGPENVPVTLSVPNVPDGDVIGGALANSNPMANETEPPPFPAASWAWEPPYKRSAGCGAVPTLQLNGMPGGPEHWA